MACKGNSVVMVQIVAHQKCLSSSSLNLNETKLSIDAVGKTKIHSKLDGRRKEAKVGTQ